MASEDEILAMILKGDRQGAAELIRAEAMENGGAATINNRITQALLKGDLAGAADLARAWMEATPRDVMPILSLAETFLLAGDLPSVLATLEQAQRVNGDHPMYYRLVFLGATAAGAFTAAHGAAFSAKLCGLPELILRDLREKAVCRSLDGTPGAYPTEENTDPRWLHLLVRSWHPERPPVRLAWDEVDGAVWIYNQDLLDAAVAASMEGTRARWTDFPEAASIAEERVRLLSGWAIEKSEIEPWMCAPWQGIYLPGALTQYGLWPTRPPGSAGTSTSVIGVETPAGRVETGFASNPDDWGAEAWARVDSVATVELASRLLVPAFNGRVMLRGPDPRISRAFAWLTSGLPKFALRARGSSRTRDTAATEPHADRRAGGPARPVSGGEAKIVINRTPVLTLWAIVVAERLGYSTDSALTLGKSVGILRAYEEGQDQGIFWKEEKVGRGLRKGDVRLLGQFIPVAEGSEGPLAIHNAKPIDPGGVCKYLEKKLGADLATVADAMRELAAAYIPEALAEYALGLFMEFQPEVPPGREGWGAKGELDVDKITRLAEEGREWFGPEEEAVPG